MHKVKSFFKKLWGYICVIETFLGFYFVISSEPDVRGAMLFTTAIFALMAYLCLKKPKNKNISSKLSKTTSHCQSTVTSKPVLSSPNLTAISASSTNVPTETIAISDTDSSYTPNQPNEIKGGPFMALKDFFYASKIREENDNLKKLLTPEMQDAATLAAHISELQKQDATLQKAIDDKNKKLAALTKEYDSKKQLIIDFTDDISVQDYALYKPRYAFANSTLYKDRLSKTRELQKYCLKEGRAATGNKGMMYNNSATQGAKLVSDMQKLLLRAFNSECDEVIGNVKYNNYDMSLKKITTSADQIAKLGKMMDISVTREYFNLKVEELQLALEFQIKKQEEKELQKQLHAEERERIRLEKEIEEQRKKMEKEQNHYQKALITIMKQLEDPEKANDSDLLAKKSELENQLGIIDSNLKELDYREANQRAGYVYIISNIDSFGEDVYKIGMTRRLEPMDRIDELGDASVPFNFDVHAMIFTDDAPGLEAALHKAFENRKVNMVNTRREFFHVTLDEIKDVVQKNFDKTVEFTDCPDADQYRISEKMRADMGISH